MKVIITEFMDEAALTAFDDRFDVHYDATLVDSPDQMAEMLTNAQAIIVRNRTQVTQAMLDGAPDLRAVGRLGVGLDNIDLDACAARDVAVLPATGANSQSVAEYVLGMSMGLLRSGYWSNADMLSGGWPRGTLGATTELGGKTLGLYGFGNIAQLLAQKARGLDMQIAAFDPFLPDTDPAWQGVERLDADSIFSVPDVLSLHVPLTDQTRGLVNAVRLDQMKSSSVLVNTARGGVVDEQALANALCDGAIAGAALDVFEVEPMTTDSGKHFKDVPNLILTPHIAGVTADANTRVSHVTVQNVINTLVG